MRTWNDIVPVDDGRVKRRLGFLAAFSLFALRPPHGRTAARR